MPRLPSGPFRALTNRKYVFIPSGIGEYDETGPLYGNVPPILIDLLVIPGVACVASVRANAPGSATVSAAPKIRVTKRTLFICFSFDNRGGSPGRPQPRTGIVRPVEPYANSDVSDLLRNRPVRTAPARVRRSPATPPGSSIMITIRKTPKTTYGACSAKWNEKIGGSGE